MERQHDQRHDVTTDCCYQQWPSHHQSHHHAQPITNVPSPMQQMEGTFTHFIQSETSLLTFHNLLCHLSMFAIGGTGETITQPKLVEAVPNSARHELLHLFVDCRSIAQRQQQQQPQSQRSSSEREWREFDGRRQLEEASPSGSRRCRGCVGSETSLGRIPSIGNGDDRHESWKTDVPHVSGIRRR